jgi:hypothetical protein
MGEPEQRHQRQILLHAHPGPGREVLCRHEETCSRPPRGSSCPRARR